MTWNYALEVTTDTPYLWWRLHELAGPTALDSSGNLRDGTYFGADITFGLFGINSDDTALAVSFNPSAVTYDAGVLLNPVDGSFPTTEFTLEWVGRDFTPNTGRTLFSYAEATEADEIRVVYTNFSGQIALYINGVVGNFSAGSGYQRNLAVNQHYALTWRSSDGRAQLWINGALVQSITLGLGVVIAGAGSFVITQDQDSVGGGFVAADALKVTLAEVAVYTSVLADTRIRAHAAAAMTSYYSCNVVPGMVLQPNDETADITDFPTSKKVNYFQRVWDTGNLVWCYFTSSVLNSNPTASSTTPTHSGSITNHNIVAIFPDNT